MRAYEVNPPSGDIRVMECVNPGYLQDVWCSTRPRTKSSGLENRCWLRRLEIAGRASPQKWKIGVDLPFRGVGCVAPTLSFWGIRRLGSNPSTHDKCIDHMETHAITASGWKCRQNERRSSRSRVVMRLLDLRWQSGRHVRGLGPSRV